MITLITREGQNFTKIDLMIFAWSLKYVCSLFLLVHMLVDLSGECCKHQEGCQRCPLSFPRNLHKKPLSVELTNIISDLHRPKIESTASIFPAYPACARSLLLTGDGDSEAALYCGLCVGRLAGPAGCWQCRTATRRTRILCQDQTSTASPGNPRTHTAGR